MDGQGIDQSKVPLLPLAMDLVIILETTMHASQRIAPITLG